MVEWKKLGDISKITIGEFVHRDKQNPKAEYPVYNGGTTNTGYYDHFNNTGNKIVISARGYAGFVNRVFSNYWAGNSSYSIDVNETIAIWHFVYYYLKNEQFNIMSMQQKGGGLAAISKKQVQELLIPIPSFAEQTRIVSILDTFTSSIENLKEQIAQRRKQYEYYRDQLLNLEGKPGVEMKTLGELFTFKNGLNKGKEYFGKGKPIIMFSNVFNSRHIDSTMIKSRVEISDNELERINAKLGDVFFTRTSETKEDVGYASVLVEDVGDCTFAGFLIRARPITNDLIPEYCKYCFSTQKIRNAIVNNSSFTTRASLTGGGLSSISFPLPPLSEQQRIVDILDKFEASIQNLEAQLSQREKQYDYYRNKLLTFE